MKQEVQIHGNRYVYEIHSDRDTLPYLLMLHGFMGDRRAFKPLTKDLSKSCNPITIDLLGHGESEKIYNPGAYHERKQVQHIISLVHEINVSSLFLYGYSMGGRLALKTVQEAPDLFKGLILESSTFGILDAEDRKKRRQDDQKRALEIKENFSYFLDQWGKLSLFESPNDARNDSSDMYRSIHSEQDPKAMAASIQGFSTGLMKPVTEKNQRYHGPVLLVAGSEDQKYIAINKTLKQIMGNAKLEKLKAGHRVHLDNPQKLTQEINLFIEQNS